MGVQKQRQPLLATELLDPLTVRITEPGVGISVDDKPQVVRRARLTFNGAVLTITAALDYGSLKICDLPDRNLMLLAVEVDLTLVKQGNTNGLLAATDLDFGVGTAAASATTLATTMINVIEKVDQDTDALSVTFQRHSNDQSTAAFPLRIADGTNSALFLNAVAIAGITADSTLTITGTVDIVYVDVGKKV
jgi:hypothetical protein